MFHGFMNNPVCYHICPKYKFWIGEIMRKNLFLSVEKKIVPMCSNKAYMGRRIAAPFFHKPGTTLNGG